MLDQHRWDELVARLSGRLLERDVFVRLVSAYSEPHRRYHSLDHVRHCLSEFDNAPALAENPDLVEFAIWLHDAVYDPKARENEEKSAHWAVEILKQAGCPASMREHVKNLILATKHSRAPEDRDTELLVDIDLSILGQPPEVFDLYEESIRSEYSWVPVPMYAAARSQVLHSFLDRPRLYFTSHFEGLYAAQARGNLIRALAALQLSGPDCRPPQIVEER